MQGNRIVIALCMMLVVAFAWADGDEDAAEAEVKTVGNLSLKVIPIKSKTTKMLSGRTSDTKVFLQGKDGAIVDTLKFLYAYYYSPLELDDLIAQASDIVAVPLVTYKLTSDKDKQYYNALEQCAFINTKNGCVLYQGDAKTCQGSWAEANVWQQEGGRLMDFTTIKTALLAAKPVDKILSNPINLIRCKQN
ncbi:hypothetical protein HZU77_003465 [Neisseriaceae bacterium TC5R-5]|nr:hypothetical protein [Neisseriaceae bacterium TC5R-5]